MFSNFLKLGNMLKTEQKIILDSTKQFCNSYLLPRVKNDYKNENVNPTIFQEMGKVGLFGITNEYGINESYLTYGLIAKEIESVDSGYRSMFIVQNSLVINPIHKFGSDYLKQKYLPELVSGNLIGCFGLTEPDHGSDAGNLRSFAIEKDNGYLLNGSKMWISNAPIADVFVIWAKVNNVLKGFILEKDFNGLDISKIEGKLSLRTSVTGSIFMENVFVPKKNVLDVSGFKGPFTCLNDARMGIAFGVLGASETCLDTTLDYLNNRVQFGESLSSKQVVQYALGDMLTEYNLSLLSCYHIASLRDENPNVEHLPEMISMIKRNSCQKSLNISRKCRDLLGGNGISEDYPVFRHLTNLETVNTYEGTETIHALILGKYLTNKSSF